ncbi:MAG: hypothetical protein WDO24_14755 [Pseudomonadota bacterium]
MLELAEIQQTADLSGNEASVGRKFSAALAIERQGLGRLVQIAIGASGSLDHESGLRSRRQTLIQADHHAVLAGPARDRELVAGDRQIVRVIALQTLQDDERGRRVAATGQPHGLVMFPQP